MKKILNNSKKGFTLIELLAVIVILARPNGEMEEKEVICHFKSVDDNKPNIKNVPILVLDKKEVNNGNQVVEFYWEKDGVYQPILDDAAWSEVKSVIIDIIKSNVEVDGVI